MAKKAKKAKDGLRAKFEKAYVEMKGKSDKERQSRCAKGGCECGK